MVALFPELQIATMKRHSRQRGFTLIELMVVISIIVILMSVAIPRYQACGLSLISTLSTSKKRRSRCKTWWTPAT